MSNEITTILVATDFSDPAEAALEAGIEHAREHGARLDLVHVYTYPSALAAPYDAALPPSYLNETKRIAEERITALAERVREAGVPVKTHVVLQPTVEGVIDVARAIGAQLIVVGTHGHTGLKHVLVGSVAERIVRHAPCNVLVARRPPTDGDR